MNVGVKILYQQTTQASVPKRSNGADCKSAGSAFTSSNLVRRTNTKMSIHASGCLFVCKPEVSD